MDAHFAVPMWPFAIAGGFLAAATIAWLRSRRRVHDLTEQITAARDRYQTQTNQLDQAHRMEAVGILAGSIVNNLNNLLAVTMGHTRMAIHELPPTASVQEELGRVLNATEMARDLVQEISDFYRQADQARKPTDLQPVVRDAIKLLRDILPTSVEVVANLKPCGPVMATTTGVQQILMNLCSNAVNAMARRQGKLEIFLTEEVITDHISAIPTALTPGSYVRLSVEDNGRGMDSDTLEHIFDSYFSTDLAHDRMGIGLSTVYRILNRHEGATSARSTLGKGTRFDIYFPMIAWSVPVPEVTPRPELAHRNSGAPSLLSTNEKATILLVDDEEMVAKVLTHGLKRLGYHVIMHTESRNALTDFSLTPELFDVLVTDQIMPHMSGVRLTRKIHEVRQDLPVVLLTGFRDSFNEVQAREAGITDFMLKPFSHRDLASLIDRLVLRKNEARG